MSMLQMCNKDRLLPDEVVGSRCDMYIKPGSNGSSRTDVSELATLKDMSHTAPRSALCCAVLCYAVLCCAVLCCAVLRRAVPCCTALCCAMPCCAVLCAELFAYSISESSFVHIKFLVRPERGFCEANEVCCCAVQARFYSVTCETRWKIHRTHLSAPSGLLKGQHWG